MDIISPSMPPLDHASDHEIPLPPPVLQSFKDSNREVHITLIPSSSLSPKNKRTSSGKGKEPMVTTTPLNSPVSSPTNSIGSDLDYLLNKKSLEFRPLTIHTPGKQSSPQISPNSVRNITVRRKNNRGSRHFRGRVDGAGSGVRNLSLIDVPIIDITEERPLRASMAEKNPQ